MGGFGTDDQTMRAIYLGALLAFLLVTFGWRRIGIGSAARSFAIWGLLILVMVVGYAYRTPIQSFFAPVLRELNPSRTVVVTSPAGEQEFSIQRGVDRHFHIEAKAGGAAIDFLVDTGATSTALTLKDAAAAGIEVETLRYDRPVQTANGMGFYARAELPSLEIGPFRIDNLAVAVMPPDAMNTSLLGLNVLDRFRSYRIEGDRMVLTP